MLSREREFWLRGIVRVAGVDEAGRGPLAGPVTAAAVVMPADFAIREIEMKLRGLTDSKKLTARQRETFYGLLRDAEEVQVGVGFCDQLEIDRLNILHATHLAMARALLNLPMMADLALVDGLPVEGLPCPSESIVRGDSLSLSIAAASIIAKVERDTCMREFDLAYPEYGFAGHKGYGTENHLRALSMYGPCPMHRFSFRPVREAFEARKSGGG